MNSVKHHTLSDIASSIERMFDQHWGKSVHLVAELNSLNFHPSSGHCYPELVEKHHGRVIAQMKAIIWKDKFQQINKLFQSELGESLSNGMKLLMEVKVKFSPVYGLSLEILQIDPKYTLGDLERERHETIAQLKSLGIFSKNQTQALAVLPRRLAIISFDSSKGYLDFTQTLATKGSRFGIRSTLFPAAMQGEHAPAQIRLQLTRIARMTKDYDAVVVVRGGGDDVGMSCFNNLSLCKSICEFPLPVITGIGHSTNLTVAEMVSYSNSITPTALAEWILHIFVEQEQTLLHIEQHQKRTSQLLIFAAQNALNSQIKSVTTLSRRELKSQEQSLRFYPLLLAKTFGAVKKWNEQKLDESFRTQFHAALRQLSMEQSFLSTTIQHQGMLANHLMVRETHRLELILLNNDLNNPEKLLKKGYSLTTKGGKIITELTSLAPGETIETITANGKLKSTITEISPNS